MMMKNELVPKRRFEGFNEEWKNYEFENLAEIVRGASPRPIQDSKWFDKNSDVGWLRISDVTEQNGKIEYLEQRLSKLGEKKTRVLYEPHLLLSIAATVGKPLINYVKTGVHDGFLIFKKPEFDLQYMYQWLEMFRPYWNKYGQPGSQVNLNSEIVKNQIVILPSTKEQQKIGQFFKHLDEMIAVQQRKLDKTKALKSGYLAEMFPAEGERVPKRRFEGFVDEWKIRKIEEVAPLRNGKGFESNNFKNNGVPIIRISNILSTGNIGGKYIYYDEEDNDADYTIPNGAALIAMSGATTGKVSVMKINNYEKVYQNQRVGMFKDLGKANYKYLITLLQSELFESQLMSVLVAGAQPNISSQEINNFEFFFPDNINEQEMVGNFFKNIDNLIATHQQKLDKLKATKQAYLHEMFV